MVTMLLHGDLITQMPILQNGLITYFAILAIPLFFVTLQVVRMLPLSVCGYIFLKMPFPLQVKVLLSNRNFIHTKNMLELAQMVRTYMIIVPPMTMMRSFHVYRTILRSHLPKLASKQTLTQQRMRISLNHVGCMLL